MPRRKERAERHTHHGIALVLQSSEIADGEQLVPLRHTIEQLSVPPAPADRTTGLRTTARPVLTASRARTLLSSRAILRPSSSSLAFSRS